MGGGHLEAAEITLVMRSTVPIGFELRVGLGLVPLNAQKV